jgi:hypothetical protein
MKVIDYITSETERQSGTVREGLGMYYAWREAHSLWDDFTKVAPITEHILIDWAKSMNPNITDYRRTPVTFNQGGHAANHENIPRLMKNLVEGLNGDLDRERHNDVTVNSANADYWTKEFLEIHPFIDCNGRVGSLLWNYIRGTLWTPEPMPYFFGES